MDTRLKDALVCRNFSKRPPIWVMRQAGRYLPEYRALRDRYSFLEMCKNPNLAAKVTLLPFAHFQLDAAILFSDILVIPEALGLGLHFEEGAGPILERPLKKAKDIEALPSIHVEEALGYVKDTISLLVPELGVPLLGFCGAPFTLASYMIEGKSSRDLRKTKQWMWEDPQSFHALLDRLCTLSIDYLKMQIQAGVTAVQVFDSWAHVLPFKQFKEFSLKYLEKITTAIKETQVPVILFCRGSCLFADLIANIQPSVISLDWSGDLASLRARLPKTIALQGNLDPDLLFAPLGILKEQVKELLSSMKNEPGYIFNLGHGIPPKVSLDAVRVLVDTVVQCQ